VKKKKKEEETKEIQEFDMSQRFGGEKKCIQTNDERKKELVEER